MTNIDEAIEIFENKESDELNLANKGQQNLEKLNQIIKRPKTLNLVNNQFNTLGQCSIFNNVTHLYIQCNNLTNLQGLEQAVSLVILNCSQNKISDVSNLKNCSKLKQLHVQFNNIASISQLECLKSLPLEELTLHEPMQLNSSYNMYPNPIIFNDEDILDFLANFKSLTLNKKINQLPKHIKDLFTKASGHFQGQNFEFQGQIQQMTPHGQGKLQLNKGQFDGEFQFGLKKFGVEENENSQIYKGPFVEEQYHGKGLVKTADLIFEGEFVQGQKIKGSMYYIQDGSYYEGDVQGGMRNGKGVYYDTDGSIYDGEWANNKANGKGVFTDPQGVQQKGIWKSNEKIE